MNILPKSFAALFIASLWFPSLTAAQGSTAIIGDRPADPVNIVFIMCDDLGYGDIGANDGWFATPQLDRLAAEGMNCTQFYVNAPKCAPTRQSVIYGVNYQRIENWTDLGIPADPPGNSEISEHPSHPGIGEIMGKAGFNTAAFGKWGIDGDAVSTGGFDEFYGHNGPYLKDYFPPYNNDWRIESDRDYPEPTGYATYHINDAVVQFIEESVAEGKPFFAYVAQPAPHNPIMAPDPADADAPREERYAKMVQAIDDGVGQILDTLERLGIEEETLVIFTSDNGPTGPGSAGPLEGGKNRLWEGGIRVPTVMWWPGTIEAGRVTDERMIVMDVLPTALAVNQLDPGPLQFDGIDFSPHLRDGGTSLGDRWFYFEYHAIWKEEHQYAIIDDNNWKWAYDLKSPDLTGHGLFDLENDIGETNNLASEYPDLVETRMTQLRAWLNSVGGEDYNKR